MTAVPWLSIITVVKDDREGFLQTCHSVNAQDLTDVEYVVIDSSAESVEIQNCIAEFEFANCTYEWVEPKGIYSAMNHALELAKGTFVMFLNAEDTFFAASVISETRASFATSPLSWGFGTVEIIETSGSSIIAPTWDYTKEQKTLFSRGLFPPHQGTFVKRETLIEIGGFDTRYSIAADYAAFLNLSKTSKPLELDTIIATFHEGGLSTHQWQQSFEEFHRARVEIFRPHGLLKWRELLNTTLQLGKVWIARKVLSRFRNH